MHEIINMSCKWLFLYFWVEGQKTQVKGIGSDFTVQLLSDIKCVLNLPVKLKEHKVT